MIIGDDCCSCSANALFLGIDDDVEPYFVSFHNRIFITPFAVLVDHKTRAILIVIRGSASFMDMITDLSFHEDFLDATVNVDVDPNLNQGIMDEESRKGFCHVDGDHKRVHRGCSPILIKT
jgi:hypothetical protein